jgi:galactan endo-1,6-beta-galactosidase
VSNLIDRVNTHTYSSTSASAKQTLRTALGTKKLWMTEYGDSDATGLKLADQIVSDMNYLKPTAWIYWQAIEPAAWGLVMATFPSTSTASTRGAPSGVNQKYYVYAHFTRWIRNGHTIYGTSDQYTVCGYDATNKIMNYVTVNHGTAQKITYDLSAFTTVTGTTATIRATQMTVGGASYVNSTASIANKAVSVQAGTYTIYTVQVTGVTP